MAIHIPPDMIPRMDWNAEDKQAAWAFYRERLEQYFVIAGTPREAWVTHILFYGGKEASEWWTALKDQVEGNKDEADTVFKAFANSFEKSSSHWQARDEYLSDIKQDKNQTTAELDIYIKDLIRRCQFPPEDQESCKIDLLYHASAHFEVRKFVHNAKQEELKYDHMIEVAKAHERTCQEYQIHKQAHSMANPSNSYANPLIQTNALSKSFQKGPPKKTCGKCGCSHSHGDCPAYGTTCSKCGRPNHWAQQCTSSGEDVTRSDGDTPEEHLHQTGSQSNNEEDSESRESATPSQSEIFSGYNNSSNNNSDCKTATSSQSEITSEYDASSEPSSREASNPSSPESGNLSVRTVYSPTSEMAIIHRTMHDAIHAIREQQGRAVTRSLLNQQKAIAASKLQCNIQIKRTSTPEHPPMSNVPPRRARARSEKANGDTSGSSEESDSEPQTSRMARFQALKMRFETPTKSEEESQSHGTFKRQRLFRKTSFQSATDCPSKEYRTPGPSWRLNGTASEGDWARPSSQEDQPDCRYCT